MLVLEYHLLTVHDPAWPKRDDPRIVRGYRPMDPSRRPPPFKEYPGLPVEPLPDELEGLSRLLFLSAGVVRSADYPIGRMYFRAAGSAGNLHPLEVYVVNDDGLFHYAPLEHGLVRLRGTPPGTAPALVVTGVPWRTAWKYTERGFRHLYWDAGSMLAHTLELAPEARVEINFDDANVNALVGADGVHEFALAAVGLEGASALPLPAPVPQGSLAHDAIEFPLITEAQRAGFASAVPGVAQPDDATWPFPEPVETVIRRRGSTRRFDPRPAAPRELLEAAFGWASRPVPGDFGPMVHPVSINHNVEGTPPGDDRTAARFLCLGQDLGGDGAFTVFHCAPVGDDARAYRAALLKAGVHSGRLHLAAFAMGFGATGLTFFDEEVRRYFDLSDWPMLVTAVGAPAYRSRPGGTPRNPVRL
jgi:SagB-type dehydrogenase family enzyme